MINNKLHITKSQQVEWRRQCGYRHSPLRYNSKATCATIENNTTVTV